MSEASTPTALPGPSERDSFPHPFIGVVHGNESNSPPEGSPVTPSGATIPFVPDPTSGGAGETESNPTYRRPGAFRPRLVTDLIREKPQPLTWVWEPFIPTGALTILSADMEVG